LSPLTLLSRVLTFSPELVREFGLELGREVGLETGLDGPSLTMVCELALIRSLKFIIIL
jgi:hypothetical protein